MGGGGLSKCNPIPWPELIARKLCGNGHTVDMMMS